MPLEEEDLRKLSQLFAAAVQQSATQAAQAATASMSQQGAVARAPKPPISISGYKTSDSTSVQDYFIRCEWSFQLSQIAQSEYRNYILVHMGTELNNALKILISPKGPEELTYDEIKTTLVNHFDKKKNQYAESIKYRQIVQEKGETLSNFTLRLRQAATHCNYGKFLDRMLTEQLLFGLESRSTCDEIISKEAKDFKEAYEIAQRLEASHKSAIEMKDTSASHTSVMESTFKVGYDSTKFKNRPKYNATRSPKKEKAHEDNTNRYSCYGCGGSHLRSQCKFRSATCFVCNRTGHIAKVCKSRTAQISDEETESDCDVIQRLNKVGGGKGTRACKHMIEVILNGSKVNMELDTGAPCGIMSKATFQSRIGNYRLLQTNRRFTSYTGHGIDCIGRVIVEVKVGSTTRKLNLYIVDGDFDSLFGREWISQFVGEIDFVKLFSTPESVKEIKMASPHLSASEFRILQQVLTQYEDNFSDTAGKLDCPPIKLHLKQDAKPVFAKAREIPYALRDAYAAGIDEKIAAGFYKRVDFSEWASTTHVVSKKDGRIRITGNYKPTVNPRIIVDEHPIPKPEHIFNKMNGSKLFCHLDITDAYSHLQIEDELAHALTLNTPTHGLIRPTRAVYGAANIPAIWQRTMESVLQDIPNVCNFFDDILIYADNFDKLLSVLKTTLTRLLEKGVKLNRSKCVFAAPAVEFLGHKIDGDGIHKSDKHVEAVRDAPKPTSHEELQLFLGKATYYGSFIPDLSTRNRPLRDMLLKKPFQWTNDGEHAYSDIKNALISPQVLMPYNPELPLLLATDASKIGLGAVLSHRMPDGRERPIAYASRTLSGTERKYSQIDKEALAIVWAVQKFFFYLYARHFTLFTDHKPLTQILDPYKSLPVLCISRMANYADFLGNFDFNVVFKTTNANANADYCSRAIMDETVSLIEQEAEYDDFDSFVIRQINQLPTNADKIASETRKDERLGAIIRILESGKSLRSYGYKSPEVNYRMAGNCLTFEHRVVVPDKLRPKILQDLHSAHLGIVKMKGIARSFVYWPGIDKDVESVAKSCVDCAKFANDPPKFREHQWQYPKGPWERIHVDYAGPFLGSMLLIITDAYSKWIDVKITSTSTSAATINILDELFASYGVPTTVVSDNGTCFSSSEFKEFLTTVGVKYHKFTAPYHPSTNGQAERSVQTVKGALKSLGANRNNLRKQLNIFLRQYRIAPHSTTGKAPALLFLGRVFRTHLDLLLPQDLTTKMTDKQYMQYNTTYRSWEPMQNVYFLSNNNRMDKWLPGVILKRLGDLHYEISYKSKNVKRHVDQIRNRDDSKANQYTNKSREIEPTNTEEIEPRHRSYAALDTSNASQSFAGNLIENSPNNASTPQQNSFDNDASAITFSSTPQSDFLGFDSSREGDEDPLQNDVKVEGFPIIGETEPDLGNQNGQVPLRRSTRVRRRRVEFSAD